MSLLKLSHNHAEGSIRNIITYMQITLYEKCRVFLPSSLSEKGHNDKSGQMGQPQLIWNGRGGILTIINKVSIF